MDGPLGRYCFDSHRSKGLEWICTPMEWGSVVSYLDTAGSHNALKISASDTSDIFPQ